MSELGQTLKIIKKSLIEQIAEKVAEIASLKAKLEKEHENFLAVHRHNMEIVGRNMELKSKLEARDEVIRNCELVIKTLLEFYIDCSNGDAEFWDAEKSIEVVQARECLSRIDALIKKG